MDKQEDWETVSVKSDKPKNSSNENIYILSDLINCGACLRCLSSNCHMTEKHGVFIPDKIKIFIKNPLYINEIKKMIDKEKNIMCGIETCNDLVPIFTTCGFTHSKKGCRNCIDGRMKQIRLNDEELTICYSIVKPNMTKITFGLHIDIKLILKDKNYQVSAIPVNILLPESNLVESSVKMNTECDFPSLGQSNDKKLNILLNSKSTVWDNKLKITPEIISVDESSTSQYPNDISTSNKKVPVIESDHFNNTNLILLKENDELKIEIDELRIKIRNLEKKNKKDEHAIQNANKFEEIINNIDILNIVSKQVLETHYSEYLLNH
jgi:hypothetical protein